MSDKLRLARPSLRMAAPLTHAICWGFAVVNTILGLGMIFLYHGSIPPIAVANLLSYWEWGAVFILLAILTYHGLMINNWRRVRNTQLASVAVKSVWAIALIIRCFQYPQTIIITAVWLFFAYIQIVTYIHFVPTNPIMDRVGMGEDRRQGSRNG